MSVITIDTSSFLKGANTLKKAAKAIENGIDDILTANALEIEETAKQYAPADRGYLRQHISTDNKRLKKTITVNAPYAAYVEFGTGKYASKYVSTLPTDWQQFANKFRGSTGGTFKEMVRNLAEWVKRTGLAGIYSVKSKRRLGSKDNQRLDDYAAAYAIARAIMVKGIKPHPFLYPAVASQKPIILEDLEDFFKHEIIGMNL